MEQQPARPHIRSSSAGLKRPLVCFYYAVEYLGKLLCRSLLLTGRTTATVFLLPCELAPSSTYRSAYTTVWRSTKPLVSRFSYPPSSSGLAQYKPAWVARRLEQTKWENPPQLRRPSVRCPVQSTRRCLSCVRRALCNLPIYELVQATNNKNKFTFATLHVWV